MCAIVDEAMLPPETISRAIVALRSVLTPNTSSTLILHALAPPPPAMDDDEGTFAAVRDPATKILIDRLNSMLPTVRDGGERAEQRIEICE